jgi:peptide/nickel transport system substrate-binding protein
MTPRALPLVVAIATTCIACAEARAQSADLTVVWADDSNSDVTFDPRVTQSRHEEQVIIQLFDQLIYGDPTGKLYPSLATAWQAAPDNRSVTLKLRDDVTFHDGSKFDADAVKFTFDTIVDPATGSQGAVDILGPYLSSDIIGPYEIRINYKRPFPNAIDSFTDDRLSIVSPAAVKKLGNTGFAQAPVGSGPFRFVSWDKGDKVTLERNPDYKWAPGVFQDKGPSKVARYIQRYIPNAATRVAALEAGEIQFSELTPPLDMRRLGQSKNFKTMVGVAPGVPLSLMLNVSHGPLQDIKVRQAFIYAIDRPRLAQNLFFGLAKASWGPLAPTTPGYWKGVEDYYKFNRATAMQLLDEAGWKPGADGIREKDGKTLQLYYPTLLEPDTSVAVQADLKRVGIDLKVEDVTKARQDEAILSNGYDVGAIRWVYNDAAVLQIPFTTANIPAPGKFKFNWMRWSDPKLDDVIAAAGAAASQTDRDKLYADAQKMIMDAAVFVPVHDQIQTIAYTAKLTGIAFARGNWQARLYDVRPAD